MFVDALPALGLALRQQVDVFDLGGDEELRGAVRAGGDARAAADARRGVHGGVGDGFGYRVRFASGAEPVGRLM